MPDNVLDCVVFWEYLAAAIGSGITDSTTNPLDVLKMRLQNRPGNYKGCIDCAAQTLKTDGVIGVWCPGLVATWIRSFTYVGTRIGLFPFFVRLYTPQGKDHPGPLGQIGAGMTTGLIAATLFSPIELIRIRVTYWYGRVCPQTGLLVTGLCKGRKPLYRHTGHAFYRILNDEGVSGMTRGAGCNMLRAGSLSGSQLGFYSCFKLFLVHHGIEEKPWMHFVGSALSGVVGQTCAMPADLLRTRVMCSADNTFMSCVRATWRAEGIPGFYRGYIPAICRQAPGMLIQFPLIEQIRHMFGLGYM